MDRIPQAFMDVALVDGATAAAVGGMSLTWWRDEVAAGRAPAPIIRRPRCSRWRLADVRAFWEAFATPTPQSAETAAKLIANATKASEQARQPKRENPGTEGQA